MTDLLRAEALRLRTVRAPLLASVLVLAGIAALMAALSAAAPVTDAAAVVRQGLALAATLCGLASALLGALGAGTDFQHGTAVTTFLSRPRRRDVLLARAATHAALGAVLGGTGVFTGLLVAFLSAQVRGFSLSGVASPVWLSLAVALGTGVAGALGVAAGMWLRSPVAAILAVIGAVTIVEPVLGSVAPVPFLPFAAFGVLAAGAGGVAAVVAIAVLAAWTVVLLGLAGRSLSRGDIAA